MSHCPPPTARPTPLEKFLRGGHPLVKSEEDLAEGAKERLERCRTALRQKGINLHRELCLADDLGEIAASVAW
eukprot:10482718-Prorocentrum_lima.AAC.1